MDSSQLHTKLIQKKTELENLKKINELTVNLNEKLIDFGNQLENLDSESESIEKVTGNWLQVIRAISLASNSLMSYKENEQEGDGDDKPMTERLVRCKLDKD
ncbi:hypothetical protein CANARDRAFT_191698, partial [[Candida] arabinofermentans NRRL YB-2248]